MRAQTPRVGLKAVSCTHCERPVNVGQRAMSIFCPHCRNRLILEDFRIRSYYAVREFATCGDIIVERQGHVVAPIKVGNLTVRGTVHAEVVARGTVVLAKTASFRGAIVAPRLRVEAGAVVEAHLRIGATNGSGSAPSGGPSAVEQAG